MHRICFTLQVRVDRIEEYKREHENVWPEMRTALQKHGWSNYSLFLRSDGLLIGYLETPDWKAALAGMQDEEVNELWQKRMQPFFESIGDQHADASMSPIAEVFHLD